MTTMEKEIVKCPKCGEIMKNTTFMNQWYCKQCEFFIESSALEVIHARDKEIARLERREEELENGWRDAEERHDRQLADLEDELTECELERDDLQKYLIDREMTWSLASMIITKIGPITGTAQDLENMSKLRQMLEQVKK